MKKIYDKKILVYAVIEKNLTKVYFKKMNDAIEFCNNNHQYENAAILTEYISIEQVEASLDA